MSRARWIAIVAGAAIAAATAACREPSCLDGGCPTPCADLAFAFACDARPMFVGRGAAVPAAYRLAHGAMAANDVVISNGIVTAVISDVGTDFDLAPTGGNLIDFGPAGGADDLTIIYQLSGILPADAFAYRALEVELAGGVARVTVRGTLDGRPDVRVVTRYELGACDPGLRVRSELFNGSPDPHAFMIADTSHWGKRRVVPFVPEPGQGYAQPELDLLALSALWRPSAYAAGATANPDSPGYGVIACDASAVYGVHDPEVSAIGSAMKIVEPGDTLIHERMIVTAGAGQGPAPAIDALLAARGQQFVQPTRVVRGRVVAAGLPFGGDVRRASVVVRAGDRPLTAVVPGADGRFEVTVPAGGEHVVEVWSFGRPVAEAPVPGGGDGDGGGDAGDLEVPLPATVQVEIELDGAPAWGLAVFHPADDATRAAVTGTFHGRFAACAPWLGPVDGGSPACNRALVDPRGAELEIPAGRYHVFATAGPEATLATAELALAPGDVAPVAFALARLAVAPPGWLSADFHVHGRASFDSGIPDDDRVRSFVAAGVDVIAATDHDVIGDYTDIVRTLGFDDRVAVMGGFEATQLIPWLDVPGEALPRVTGHFNFWPLARVPGAPRGGAPSDERIEPGALFDVMAPLVGPGGMMMLNHPWDEPLFGRDLGYLRAIKFDPRVPLGADHALRQRPGGGLRNADWNVIEIINGADPTELQKARVVWHALLAQGFVAPGTGNSDSHSLNDAQLGWARNWVEAGAMTVPTFDARRFHDAVRGGRMSAGVGVVVIARVGPAAGPHRVIGLAPHEVRPGDVVDIEVRAAPWIPVDEVRVVTSAGTRVIASGAQLARPADPFGVDGLVRYRAQVPLVDLVDRDDFVIIEAGLAYPLAADLDDDGVPDTTDNNGDGVIDADDVEPDADAGPLAAPADPREPSDPRYWVTRVVPLAWPIGFANPILVDLDGGGWQPPGLR